MSHRLPARVASRFPAQVSPHHPELRWHSQQRGEWFYGDVPERVRNKFRREMFDSLTAYTYPWASLATLEIIHDFYWSVVVIDDHLDRPGFRGNVTRTRSALAHYADVLAYPDTRGTPAVPQDPNARLVQTWWHALVPRTEPAWRRRFVGHMNAWFDACCWETDQLGHNRPFEEGEFWDHRLHLFGSQTYMDMLHLDLPQAIPEHVHDSPLYQRYLNTAVECLCYFNDLISYRVEESAGSAQSNLISILKTQYGCGLEAAASHVADLYALHTQQLVDLEPQIQIVFPEHKEALHQVFGRVGRWQAGFIRWHEESGRYSDPKEEGISVPQPTS
ncbi:hypothetical protein AB0I53_46290 [Saccharopolyspora sp. NPDC050389]|uniref:terpene synthase family protein n=1 Tax=Saccharopolyspora sp. NPDC050389 TaxID=3155516 RepID=UPI0033D23CDC